MILNKSNEVFEYEGKKYRIGDRVVATPVSDEYEGLIGHITEIRDGDDKDTENETPDIYCTFYEPITPYDIEQIEERFSNAYGEPKRIEDIILDIVIMAPEMIEVITDLEKSDSGKKVYVVTDDWAENDEYDSKVEAFSSLMLAKAYMREQVRQMADYGGLFDRRGEEECVEESSDLSYEIYIEGWYCSNHYSIQIKEKNVHK